MTCEVYYSSRFKKDLAKVEKGGKDLKKLYVVVELLKEGKTLEERYRDHKLQGEYIGYRECHIEPDWVLIYKFEKNRMILVLTRTGSHAKIFDM
ncbi:MAG: type II toxin-antitoxin system YafQ family toxin [Coprobacillus sp.]|nr:type II toxin-antitoxin system YafQ family toxin [Coprobacillus sp.]